MINDVLILLFSLMGVVLGVILTLIAPEEIREGKKYFVLLKRFIFITIYLLVFVYLINQIYLYPFVLFSVILFILDFKSNKKILYVLHYLVFIPPYFLNTNQNFQLILASLIFLYGFPVGSLLRIEHEKEERS